MLNIGCFEGTVTTEIVLLPKAVVRAVIIIIDFKSVYNTINRRILWKVVDSKQILTLIN